MTDVARLGVGIELVGRRHEVSALAGALERAAVGKPTGLLMSGDAGGGKSRLVADAVVLATYRSDDLHRRHPLRPLLSELVRLPQVERIDLTPLDARESLELVRLLADGSLSTPMLRRIARRSEGNAFFAEELVSASSDGLPHGLVEVLVARIEGLSAT